MRRAALTVVAVVLLSISVLAGEYLINESVAYGLRVTFTEPVTLTYYGDVLLEVSPEGEADEFVFSGAELPAWVGHGLAWTPTTARIVESAWLSESQLAALGTATVPRWKTDTLSVELISSRGEAISATVIRTISQEQIPFVVEYFVELPASASSITWTDLGSWTSIEGPEARFVLSSNAESGTILLEIETDAGASYSWLDELDFLLHSKTQITLDATQFVPEQEIVSVQWSAVNGDPDDAKTFPIADPLFPLTTLVSEWPNVLDIQCDVLKTDGTTETRSAESLIYFRDGTPFEIRSIAATVFGSGIPPDTLADMLGVMFPSLRELGFNAVTTAIDWWYGCPDVDGDFNIHPIYNPNGPNAPGDPRGETITPDQLETYLSLAHGEQFAVNIEMRQFAYRNDSVLSQDWGGWGPHFGFRWSDAWLYGENGYENMLLEYLPILEEYDVASVFLGAENGDIEAHGSAESRTFYEDVISSYRAGGYTGAMSYALCYWHNPDWPEMAPLYPENLDPAQCGIPWNDMDYIGLTFYPKLTDRFDAATSEMYSEALHQISEYLVPLHEAYDKPLFIEDMYCFGFDGCAIWPVNNSWRMSNTYSPEEQRRWHTAWLRAFSNANGMPGTPLIKGITMYEYSLDVWFRNVPFRDRVMKAYVNAEENEHLRVLAKVFFRDVPLQQQCIK